MKNALKYFYNISTDDIIKVNDNYKITSNHEQYFFILHNSTIDSITYIYKFLVMQNIYCHEIILNKDNEIITNIDNNNYILLKILIKIQKIGFKDIINYNIFVQNNKCNWYNLWCEKIDYYEYQMSQYKRKYPLLYKTFSYYNGLTENAINIISNYKNQPFSLYISHNRILKNYSSLEFYNPINMILDIKVRDICEYFKYQFFFVNNPIDEVNSYIKNIALTNEEAIFFFARMLYPSYYFDLYDLIIQEKVKEEKISVITDKTNDYEIFIKNIYHIMSFKYKIPEIEWLVK